jgi:aminoglycoside phosphotransferase family enzyme/predicted kinase
MAISTSDQHQSYSLVTEAASDREAKHRTGIEAALREPTFYPHPVRDIQVEETHISKVFLTGDFVYKIKKPVDLVFLDFTSLEKRRHFCEQEVLLNQRLSHQVYLDVVPITLESGGYALNGPGEPVEYAVKMRQLPRERTMLELVRQGRLSKEMLQKLIRVLVRFYQKAQKGPTIEAMGSQMIIEGNMEEDFVQTEPFVPSILNPDEFSRLHAAVRAFLSKNTDLFQHRTETGFICDCHGDLRLGHIYFLDRDHFPSGIQIIDCIEFNNRFRYGDVAADLAFLAMDLDYQGFEEVGQMLIRTYAHAANDPEIFLLVDFYKCYRAHVRCKVECLRQAAADLPAEETRKAVEKARRYFDLACGYGAKYNRQTLWIICGLSGSGKSTIAEELAKRLNVRLLGSDVIRKEFFGLEPDEPAGAKFGEGIYNPVATAQTYERMLMAAREELNKGNSVIVDATFAARKHRDEFQCLAKDMETQVVFIECICPNAVLRKRLSNREYKPSVSDARLQHLEAQRQTFEPLNELPTANHLKVKTDQPLQEILQEVFSTAYVLLGRKTGESSSLNRKHDAKE